MKKAFKFFIVSSILVLTICTAVFAADIDDPYGKCIAPAPITIQINK